MLRVRCGVLKYKVVQMLVAFPLVLTSPPVACYYRGRCVVADVVLAEPAGNVPTRAAHTVFHPTFATRALPPK